MSLFFSIILKILEFLGKDQTDWAKKKDVELKIESINKLDGEKERIQSLIGEIGTDVEKQKVKIFELESKRTQIYEQAKKTADTLSDADLINQLDQLCKS